MHPLDAPGSLWVLSNDGKYLARPQAGETSHKKQISCGRQRKGPSLLFLFWRGFRLCGGDQGAFRSPPGPLRGPSLYGWEKHPTRNKSLAEGRKRAYLSFPASQRVSPLRRRPKGFPIALWKPSALCCNTKSEFAKRRFLVAGRKQAFLFSAEKKLPHKQSKPPTRPYALWEANHHYNFPNSLNSSRFAP